MIGMLSVGFAFVFGAIWASVPLDSRSGVFFNATSEVFASVTGGANAISIGSVLTGEIVCPWIDPIFWLSVSSSSVLEALTSCTSFPSLSSTAKRVGSGGLLERLQGESRWHSPTAAQYRGVGFYDPVTHHHQR